MFPPPPQPSSSILFVGYFFHLLPPKPLFLHFVFLSNLPSHILSTILLSSSFSLHFQSFLCPNPVPILHPFLPNPMPILHPFLPNPVPILHPFLPNPMPILHPFLPNPVPILHPFLPNPMPILHPFPPPAEDCLPFKGPSGHGSSAPNGSRGVALTPLIFFFFFFFFLRDFIF